jgi:hypothetical protein
MKERRDATRMSLALFEYGIAKNPTCVSACC